MSIQFEFDKLDLNLDSIAVNIAWAYELWPLPLQLDYPIAITLQLYLQ